ncbi:MAG: D-2-hydroxyacid dehydrogenase, partial [Treponemataceae bacterium]|nr:D-2-hydroxyacid dehydrogenase [Treponemataceae bacterium]
AAKAAGICVTNIPAYSTMAVAQHVFSLITYFTNHVALHNDSVRSGGWIRSENFCYWNAPLMELCGKTLGIFGYGHIGRQVAAIGRAFGMNVVVCPHKPDSSVEGCVERDELFARSDFLTLHAPLTDETKGIINARTISLMKPGAYIINTARGALADEADVRAALEGGALAGYAADVLCEEPMLPDCPLLGAPNCVITPHIAWAPLETRKRLLDIALANFECWLRGAPQNTVC